MASTIRFITLVICFYMSLSSSLRAQQVTMFSNFYDNQFFYNPAVAGAKYYGELRGVFRQQWQGIDDAPMTQYLGYQQGLKEEPFGLGIIGFNDRAGQLTNMGALAALAYHLQLGQNLQISLGFSGGFSRWSIDQESARLQNSFDNTIMQANNASVVPLLNLGLQLNYKGLYLGLSSPQILESEVNYSEEASLGTNDLKRHFFATAGYYLPLSNQIGVEPQAHFRYFETAPEQLNLGLRLHLSQIWLGAYHTLGESIGMQGGLELARALAVYYAYDGTTTGLSGSQTGSHEIGLAYLIGKNRDTDGDGILDHEDECPEEPGPVENNGCPEKDRDEDGIPDDEDECPDDPGLAKYAGCPDTDGDGLIDKIDECPEEPGKPENNGCPDTDGDGILDHKDECPNVAGLKEHRGCPDTDGDGISDKLDNCPNEAGPKENSGCPWRDTDGDGLLDNVDRCPTLPGPETNGGCPLQSIPDSDGDGVTDDIDDCPRTAGPVSNGGCPEVSESQEQTIYLALVNLEFEFDKSIIKPSSFPYLDQLAELMVSKRDWKLRIVGHTDNVGPEDYNMRLSRDRALATRNYLMARGMANTQFIVQYFGETQPIDSNETELGRQRNRRVELEFIFD